MLTVMMSVFFAVAVAAHAASDASSVDDLQLVDSGDADELHLVYGDCQGAWKWTLERISSDVSTQVSA